MTAGAILTRGSDFTVTSSLQTLSWGSASQFGGTFWSFGAATRLTIPAGVTRVTPWFYSFAPAGSAAMDFLVRLSKNGSALHDRILDGIQYASFAEAWGYLDVAEGDYFEVAMQRFTGSDKTLPTDQCFFGMMTGERQGVAAGQLSSDTTITSETSLAWTVSLDTMSAHDGTTGFVVPSGVSRAVVNITGRLTTFIDFGTLWRLKVDGTTIRTHSYSSLWAAAPPCFGVIEVTPGEVITVTARLNNVNAILESDHTRISVEWF